MTHVLAKVAAWAQFGFNFLASYAANNGLPHNWQGWAALGGSALVAVGMHAAANTDGTK